MRHALGGHDRHDHHRRAVQRCALLDLPAERRVEVLVPQGEQPQQGHALPRGMRDGGIHQEASTATTARSRQHEQAAQPGAAAVLQGGRILDPFTGSGTTLVAADLEGYSWTGIEMTGHYYDVARARLSEKPVVR